MTAVSDPTALAVLDCGKTNVKLIVFSAEGAILAEYRTRPHWRDDGPYRHLDDGELLAFVNTSLADAVVHWNVGHLMFSTHGCTCALIGEDGLVMPILDYEWPIPEDVDAAFRAIAPDFGETYSPELPLGLNYAKQIFYLERLDPERFARVTAILSYPQFWAWRLGGALLSEVSYIGCHSHLWTPERNDFSSLVDERGWRRLFPPFARSGKVVGRYRAKGTDSVGHTVTVHNGVHDSNASLYFYRAVGWRSFTLVSTGTWVVIFNTDCPLDALDPARDMLANVTVDGEAIATGRFMGGREFDVISGAARRDIPLSTVETVIGKDIHALPSFAPGGPFPNRTGRLVGPEPADEMERAALAALYLALMTDTVLTLLRSGNPIVVDGGLTHNAAYLQILAALRPDQPLLMNPDAEGTAAGAAALAFEALGRHPFKDPCRPVTAMPIEGLAAYRERWRALVEAGGGS